MALAPQALATASFTVSFSSDFQVQADASLVTRVEVSYDLAPGFLLHHGSKAIAQGEGAMRVSDLSVLDVAGRAMSSLSRYKDGWLVVHFEFDPPFIGPGLHSIVLQWTLADAVCGGDADPERCFADWAGHWDVPVTGANFSFGFAPGLGADLSGVCAGSEEGVACRKITSPSSRRLDSLRMVGTKLEYSPSSVPRGLYFSWPARVLSSPRECQGAGSSSLVTEALLGTVAVLAAVGVLLALWFRKDASRETAYWPVSSYYPRFDCPSSSDQHPNSHPVSGD